MLLLDSPPHQIIVNIMCDFISDIPKNYLPYSAKKLYSVKYQQINMTIW